MKFITASVLLLFSFLSASGKDHLVDMSKEMSSLQYIKGKADAQKDSTLVFKNLYLGMPIEEAMHALAYSLKETNLASGFMYSTNKEGELRGLFMRDKAALVYPRYHILVKSVDGHVTSIELSRKILDLLFDSKDLQWHSLIDKFREVYGVPDIYQRTDSIMHRTKVTGLQSIGFQRIHHHSSPQGYTLSFYDIPNIYNEDKALELKKTQMAFYKDLNVLILEIIPAENTAGFN